MMINRNRLKNHPFRRITIWHENELTPKMIWKLKNFNATTIPSKMLIQAKMDDNEDREHHLIHALKMIGDKDFSIPIPDVTIIPDDEYDELYPKETEIPPELIKEKDNCNETMVKFQHSNYDADDEDQKWWIETKLSLEYSLDYFEKIIEWLELECQRLKRPSTLEQLSLVFSKKNILVSSYLLTSVYDYWLSKRLITGKTMMPMIQIETGPNEHYVVFRKDNLRKLIQRKATKKYNRRNEKDFSNVDANDDDDNDDDSILKEEEIFPFIRKPGCRYHAPKFFGDNGDDHNIQLKYRRLNENIPWPIKNQIEYLNKKYDPFIHSDNNSSPGMETLMNYYGTVKKSICSWNPQIHSYNIEQLKQFSSNLKKRNDENNNSMEFLITKN